MQCVIKAGLQRRWGAGPGHVGQSCNHGTGIVNGHNQCVLPKPKKPTAKTTAASKIQSDAAAGDVAGEAAPSPATSVEAQPSADAAGGGLPPVGASCDHEKGHLDEHRNCVHDTPSRNKGTPSKPAKGRHV